MNILNKQLNNRRGSALIIVVVLVVMLAIVGFTFVMISRLNALGAGALADAQQTDAAMDYLVNRVGTLIAQDAYNGEDYDYPGNNDTWLASIEPYIDPDIADNDPNKFVWAQISDFDNILRNNDIRVSDVHADPEGNLSDSNGKRETIDEYQEIFVAESNIDSDGDSVVDIFKGDLFKGDEYSNGEFEGQWADADGDGAGDAKWFKVPDVRTPTGEFYYAAIRIIDNSGLINVNTAYRDDRDAYDAADDYLFYGDSQLSVNLEGLLNPSDDIDELFDYRGAGLNGNVASEWNDYHQMAVKRLSNPDKSEEFALFNMADELSLRNRFFINPGIESSLEEIIPDTLNGEWGSKDRPFMGGDYGTLLEWGTAVTGGDTGVDPDVRHLLTAISKSREMAPEQIQAADLATGMEVLEGRRKALVREVAETDDNEALTIEQIAGNIYYAIKDNELTNHFGDYFSNGAVLTDLQLAERIAWFYTLNLVDYQFENVDIPSYKAVNNDTYFGFEGLDALLDDTLIVSEYAYYKNTNPGAGSSFNPALQPNKQYYMIELYNPSPNSKEITLLSDYSITLFGSGGTRKIDLYADVFSATNTTINGGEIILITNDLADSEEAFGIAADYEVNNLDFAQDEKIYVHKIDWPNAVAGDMPVDICEVILPLDTQATIESSQKRDEFGENTGLLCPESWRMESYITLPHTLGDEPTIRNSIEINLETTGIDIYNIGEIANVFAIGAFSDSANIENDMPFTSALEAATDALGDADPLKIWGRFDFTDEDTRKLFDYLTVFDTAWDGIDTDKRILSTDKPLDDGIDNDGDGTIDDVNEDQARFYETVVHGRVNINTAPERVIEQLPWMTEELAAAVVARRDARLLVDPADSSITLFDYTAENKGFTNIGQMLDVTNDDPGTLLDYDIQQYGKDNQVLDDYPDFDPDAIEDDYKERGILFERISNCITTKSDVFTAYILLRAGAEGEQKRVMVIYDRSNVYGSNDSPEMTIGEASLPGR